MLLDPLRLVRHISDVRRIVAGGGPAEIRLVRVDEPRGLLLQSAEAVLDVKPRQGATVRLKPELPLPFLLGWGIRAARALELPGVSRVKPESFAFRIRVPGASA